MSNVYVIAEIGINHNGNFELAKKLIKKSQRSGANAVKFQKRTIELVYTSEELDKYRESPWGTTNRAQKEGLEFSMEQYSALEKYSTDLGLDFIVSCWDLNSIDLVEQHLNVAYHKVASALATDKKFLQKLNETGKPVILSTGMCTTAEIEAAVTLLDNVEYVLACTSTYPTQETEINLQHISTMREQFPNKKIGFSNHYNGLLACVGATALGAECIEFHVTNDRTSYGSDQAASIERAKELIRGVRKVELMIGNGEKTVYETELPIINKLRKINDITK
jgi:N-acetylneuraminate synthase|tara:strand:- start:1182 stop:2018 length:837 start_codon:yes stop_codon:yes gene_type:complete